LDRGYRPKEGLAKPTCAAGERRTERGKDAGGRIAALFGRPRTPPREVPAAARRARGFRQSLLDCGAMARQLLLLLLAFALGAAVAGALGAGLGVAFGAGQVCFAVVLVFVLLRG
jgi:hypothetical protein